MMDTVLFTDHGIVVFATLSAAAALLLSVLGLATTQQIRADMKDQFRLPMEGDTFPKPGEWASLRDEFNVVMREGAGSIEGILDEQFRRRFADLMYRTAHARRGPPLLA